MAELLLLSHLLAVLLSAIIVALLVRAGTRKVKITLSWGKCFRTALFSSLGAFAFALLCAFGGAMLKELFGPSALWVESLWILFHAVVGFLIAASLIRRFAPTTWKKAFGAAAYAWGIMMALAIMGLGIFSELFRSA